LELSKKSAHEFPQRHAIPQGLKPALALQYLRHDKQAAEKLLRSGNLAALKGRGFSHAIGWVNEVPVFSPRENLFFNSLHSLGG
jgi:hypothetical protein